MSSLYIQLINLITKISLQLYILFRNKNISTTLFFLESYKVTHMTYMHNFLKKTYHKKISITFSFGTEIISASFYF